METKCPKCGGIMCGGEIKFNIDNMMPNQMNSYMSGMSIGSIPTFYDKSVSKPFWEESTGKKTGLIFKRDETKLLGIKGLRCTLCGYIEQYVIDDKMT